jgi:hypothetical protein
MKKYYFRITKYNPENRNEMWHYNVDEWTAISDIKKYNVDWDEYKNIELAYIDIVVNLLKKFNYDSLEIFQLEKWIKWKEFDKMRIRGFWKKWKMLFKDVVNNWKIKLSLEEFSIFIRLLLREMLWWVISWDKIEIKVWYDYYLFLTTTDENVYEYLKNLKDNVLFIEELNNNND